MRFVRGDDHVRDALRESGVSAANVVTVVGDDTFGSGDLRAKYVQLCRKLEMRDSVGKKRKKETLTGRNYFEGVEVGCRK